MSTPSHNLEIKARCHDLTTARDDARRLCGSVGRLELQTDTYFHAPQGRLKLREIDGQPAVLIAYQRPNERAVRTSAYHLVPVVDAASLKSALEAVLGIRGVVRKRRHIFLWHNVRIHLDDVDQLGTFIELEAVLSEEEDVKTSQDRLQYLTDQLNIRPDDVLAPSYADLLGLGDGSPHR